LLLIILALAITFLLIAAGIVLVTAAAFAIAFTLF